MISRRNLLSWGLGAGAATVLPAWRAPQAWAEAPLITRPIPSTGERLPAVGLGSSATFSRLAGSDEAQRLRAVFEQFVQAGGRVFDTAPAYGASEAVAGQIVQEAGVAGQLFWATKVNVARGGAADPAQARAQIDASFARIGRPVVDLIQVHNMGDIPTQLGLLKTLKDQGKVRYVGATTTFERQYDALEALLRAERLDFIGVDYAIDNRTMESRILPLAAERGTAVLVYAPFGRTRLWDKVKGHDVPPWAAELGIQSWAQFFLKFVLAHPAVTCATPATSRPANVIDNLGAARGPLPDEAMRERMAAHIAGL